MWQDRDANQASYEVPAGSGVSSMFAGSLWLGGVSESQQLHCATQTFANEFDFYPGPLSLGDASTSQLVCAAYDDIHHVTRQEVVCHRAFHQAQLNGTTDLYFPDGYATPSSILNWPAHGDVALGQDYWLAPFVDFNGNGLYDPENGDYPRFAENDEASCDAPFADELHGDESLFWIFNDKGNAHYSSQGEPLGVEIHAQAWGWQSNVEALNNTTFYTYKIINRSTNNYEDFRVGWWSDSDVGTATDDYVGCDVSRGMGYSFNGDANDEPSSSSAGYGVNPPAIGIDFVVGLRQDDDAMDNPLTSDLDEALANGGVVYEGLGSGFGDGEVDNERLGMTGFLYYNNSSNPINGEPNVPAHYHNYMKSVWKNGQALVYGGDGVSGSTGAQLDVPTTAMFQGDSDPLLWSTGGLEPSGSLWTEVSSGNPPSDRRFVMSMGPVTLESGAQNDFTMAAVWAVGDVETESVEALKQADDLVQALFDSCFDGMGCMNEDALNYDPNATISTPGACLTHGAEGCTYPHAVNFSPIALVDDGSCLFPGCTDPESENYEPHASIDDGSCWSDLLDCLGVGDLDGDLSVGTSDLLLLLTSFGYICD